MKQVHVFTVAMAALFAASCSNEELVNVSNGEITGEMIDAKDFKLVSNGFGVDPLSRVTYYPQYVQVTPD